MGAGDWQGFHSDPVPEVTVPRTLSLQSETDSIGLAGLAAKKIPPVAKKKSSDNDQKMILAGLSLKGGEKDKDAPPASSDPRQTVLVPSASSQGLQIMVQKQELGAKRVEKAKSKGAGSNVGRSSKQPLEDDDDLEVLEEGGLSQKARRPHTASSKSL
ncbi:hypothetical protein Fot_13808 [Forsythia ovata]|uniref:Uncharacterized protein n=1 Tax=Forsythia ovata TaxID=205694 RepID=A0ABD1W4I8_9LAMI